jgi:SAM-dependent methyltransferase
MSILDKRDLLARIQDMTLDLGCGPSKKSHDSVGIDIIDYESVDIVGDVYEILSRIPESCISAVYSSHFFEHVRDVHLLLRETLRILKPGGMLTVVVPHFSNPYFYSDISHLNFFGLYSFSYLAKENLFRRKVPGYFQLRGLELVRADMIFKSPPPFYVRYGLKRIVQAIVNLSSYTKEFYEENCCYLFPCYEIRFLLKKTNGAEFTTSMNPPKVLAQS